MQSEVRFSIVIPFSNVEDFIDKCIASVIAQSYRNFEVFLVNDGSADGTSEKVLDWEKRYENVRCLYQESSGPNIARNRAMDCATGDYLVFLDSDDLLEPNALEVLSEKVNAHPGADYVNYGFLFFDSGAGKVLRRFEFEEESFSNEEILVESLLGRKFVGICWNKCIKREFLELHSIRFFPDKMHGRDILFCRICALRAKSVLNIGEVLTKSRIREGSFSRDFSKQNILSAIDLSVKQRELLQGCRNADVPDLLAYAVGKHLRYILFMSAFKSRCWDAFMDHRAEVARSEFGQIAFRSASGGAKYLTWKDRIFVFLLNWPLLMRSAVAALKASGFRPY